MKTILITTIMMLSSMTTQTDTNGCVYICTGPKAYSYHCNRNCRGLNKCSDDIIQVTLSEAQTKYHRKACGICY